MHCSIKNWRIQDRSTAVCLLLALLGLSILPTFVFADVPSATRSLVPQEPDIQIEIVTPKSISNRLQLALSVPKIKVKVPTVPVAKIVVLAVPIAIQKIMEAHLVIPRIKVDAVIKDTGTTTAGAMAVPGNRIDVGWFSPGTRPGETGSAVIGGHNRWDGGGGVFENLDELVKGDILTVINAQGVSYLFVVVGTRTFDPDADGKTIFDSASGVHLNLITCSGVWDADAKSYTKRLVIFSDSMPGNPPPLL